VPPKESKFYQFLKSSKEVISLM